MWMAQRILELVMPAEQASATVGDLVEADGLVWLSALRIAGATVVRQWTSAPMQVVKSLGYSLLLWVRFLVIYVCVLALGGVLQNRSGGHLMAVFLYTIVAFALAEFLGSYSLRKHAASEPGISRFVMITRTLALLAQSAELLTSNFEIWNHAYNFGLATMLGVLIPIQAGRLLARRTPGRELSSGLAAFMFWGSLWAARYAYNPNIPILHALIEPLFFPMMLVGVLSARRGRLREDAWQQ